MGKERDIQILEYNIAEIDKKLLNFAKYNIDEQKIEALEAMKLKYENQLADIQST